MVAAAGPLSATMDDVTYDPRYFDDDQPRRRSPRKRARMGALVARLGSRAKARPVAATSVESRERQARAKALLDGGKNKGEQKGYGATASSDTPPSSAP